MITRKPTPNPIFVAILPQTLFKRVLSLIVKILIKLACFISRCFRRFYAIYEMIKNILLFSTRNGLDSTQIYFSLLTLSAYIISNVLLLQMIFLCIVKS